MYYEGHWSIHPVLVKTLCHRCSAFWVFTPPVTAGVGGGVLELSCLSVHVTGWCFLSSSAFSNRIIKVWLFLLYLLNCWSFCIQTCFYKWKLSCEEISWLCERFKVTEKVQNIIEYLIMSGLYFLHHWGFCSWTRCVDLLGHKKQQQNNVTFTRPSANTLGRYWQ